MSRGGGLVVALALALLVHAPARAADEPADSAESLRERFARLRAQDSPPFDLPLHLVSSQNGNALRGDIFSSLDHRFELVREALRRPGRWCEIMILHPNVKGCGTRAGGGAEAGALQVQLGRAGHEVAFDFRIARVTDDYLDVRLHAPTGPAGTTDYRIRIEATPLDEARTILHIAYSHGFGVQAKLAMDAYFATFGRDKVGFSIAGRDAAGKPRYVRDLRGGLERNAMRYYLAIRAYLESFAQPGARRLEQALHRWLGYIELWPLQLAEEPGYAERKRQEIARMGQRRE